MAPQEIVVDAILFDMDGTLIDSTPVADLTYQQFVERHTLENTGHLHVRYALFASFGFSHTRVGLYLI